MLGTLTGLLDFGFYTRQAEYVHLTKQVIDAGVHDLRTTYGAVLESSGPLPAELEHLRGRCKSNSASDLLRSEVLLGLHGYPEYFDDVERILRNQLLASQYLDPTITTGPSAEEARAADSEKEVFTDAARRACGGFSFTLPNDLIHPAIEPVSSTVPERREIELAADIVGGAMDGIVEAWKAIVTRDEAGLRVNLLFSKETPELDVRSYIPAQGRVELDIKQPTDVYVRIPGYVNVQDLRTTLNGEELPKRIFGPYLLIPRQPGPATAVIEFEQVPKVEEETISGVTYRVEWRGDTVWNITPPGERLPIYTPARLALYGVTPD